MKMTYWILIGHTPFEASADEWSAQFVDAKARRVVETKINGKDIIISTVFLGTDYSFSGWADSNHIPVLFETMIFGTETPENNRDTWRWRSWDEAILGHDKVLRAVLYGTPWP